MLRLCKRSCACRWLFQAQNAGEPYSILPPLAPIFRDGHLALLRPIPGLSLDTGREVSQQIWCAPYGCVFIGSPVLLELLWPTNTRQFFSRDAPMRLAFPCRYIVPQQGCGSLGVLYDTPLCLKDTSSSASLNSGGPLQPHILDASRCLVSNSINGIAG